MRVLFSALHPLTHILQHHYTMSMIAQSVSMVFVVSVRVALALAVTTADAVLGTAWHALFQYEKQQPVWIAVNSLIGTCCCKGQASTASVSHQATKTKNRTSLKSRKPSKQKQKYPSPEACGATSLLNQTEKSKNQGVFSHLNQGDEATRSLGATMMLKWIKGVGADYVKAWVAACPGTPGQLHTDGYPGRTDILETVTAGLFNLVVAITHSDACDCDDCTFKGIDALFLDIPAPVGAQRARTGDTDEGDIFLSTAPSTPVAHEDGLEYGANAAGIAADNMAAHAAASLSKRTREDDTDEDDTTDGDDALEASNEADVPGSSNKRQRSINSGGLALLQAELQGRFL